MNCCNTVFTWNHYQIVDEKMNKNIKRNRSLSLFVKHRKFIDNIGIEVNNSDQIKVIKINLKIAMHYNE